jgi:hypothetical protein
MGQTNTAACGQSCFVTQAFYFIQPSLKHTFVETKTTEACLSMAGASATSLGPSFTKNS